MNSSSNTTPTVANGSTEYRLIVRQQPKAARMCGLGGKADRRPIDPPPIVQLIVVERDQAATSSAPSADPPPSSASSYLQNPYYFMFASLASPDSDDELHVLKDGKTRCTTGSVVSSLYHLKDSENNGKDAGFFVFPDLSVRTEGSYRLKLSLFEVKGAKVHHCKSIFSNPFYVYTAKKFPGMEESTPLSCSLADQGIKIRIRKDIRVRKKLPPVTASSKDADRPPTADDPEESATPASGSALGNDEVRTNKRPRSESSRGKGKAPARMSKRPKLVNSPSPKEVKVGDDVSPEGWQTFARYSTSQTPSEGLAAPSSSSEFTAPPPVPHEFPGQPQPTASTSPNWNHVQSSLVGQNHSHQQASAASSSYVSPSPSHSSYLTGPGGPPPAPPSIPPPPGRTTRPTFEVPSSHGVGYGSPHTIPVPLNARDPISRNSSYPSAPSAPYMPYSQSPYYEQQPTHQSPTPPTYQYPTVDLSTDEYRQPQDFRGDGRPPGSSSLNGELRDREPTHHSLPSYAAYSVPHNSQQHYSSITSTPYSYVADSRNSTMQSLPPVGMQSAPQGMPTPVGYEQPPPQYQMRSPVASWQQQQQPAFAYRSPHDPPDVMYQIPGDSVDGGGRPIPRPYENGVLSVSEKRSFPADEVAKVPPGDRSNHNLTLPPLRGPVPNQQAHGMTIQQQQQQQLHMQQSAPDHGYYSAPSHSPPQSTTFSGGYNASRYPSGAVDPTLYEPQVGQHGSYRRTSTEHVDGLLPGGATASTRAPIILPRPSHDGNPKKNPLSIGHIVSDRTSA